MKYGLKQEMIMNEKTPEQKTTPDDDELRKAKRDKGRELFAKMAKVKTYPVDHRPAGTVDDEDS